MSTTATCISCTKTLPVTDFDTYLTNKGGQKPLKRCKSCVQHQATSHCKGCDRDLPLAQFTTYHTKKEGIKPMKKCKSCMKPPSTKAAKPAIHSFLQLPIATQKALKQAICDRRNKVTTIASNFNLSYIQLNGWIKDGAFVPDDIVNYTPPDLKAD